MRLGDFIYGHCDEKIKIQDRKVVVNDSIFTRDRIQLQINTDVFVEFCIVLARIAGLSERPDPRWESDFVRQWKSEIAEGRFTITRGFCYDKFTEFLNSLEISELKRILIAAMEREFRRVSSYAQIYYNSSLRKEKSFFVEQWEKIYLSAYVRVKQFPSPDDLLERYIQYKPGSVSIFESRRAEFLRYARRMDKLPCDFSLVHSWYRSVGIGKETGATHLFRYLSGSRDRINSVLVRRYLYNPSYDFIRGHDSSFVVDPSSLVSDKRSLVQKDQTRKIFETLLGREILWSELQKYREVGLYGKLVKIKEMTKTIYSRCDGVPEDNEKIYFDLYNVVRGDSLAVDRLYPLRIEGNVTPTQFIDGYIQLCKDIENELITVELGNVIKTLLDILVLTQMIAWQYRDMCLHFSDSEINAKFTRIFREYMSNVNFVETDGRGRVSSSYSGRPVATRGIIGLGAIGSSSSLRTDPHYSGSVSCEPSLERSFWLTRAFKRHQVFVTSISGICLLFGNIFFLDLHSGVCRGVLSEEDKLIWSKVFILLSSVIVFYFGGHSFFECIKGFKLGIEGDCDWYLKWKDFCFSRDLLSDEVLVRAVNCTCDEITDVSSGFSHGGGAGGGGSFTPPFEGGGGGGSE